ncbi:MAG TPA: metallophosphatase domain-containing protein [Pyrinomonadaceae bacterium]|jgi:Icc-related predicted phosphoesterase|nr:metallophosphatase domain-containing protein [Pyrinomonadaceae bacterium]
MSSINLPKGDVLIHCGDFTVTGTVSEITQFNRELLRQANKFNHIIIIAGNHDLLFERQPQLARSLLDSRVNYLQDSFCVIDGIKFYGSPYQPRFFDWAFNLMRGAELAEKWNLIPDETDVLITHGPPFGILDEVPRQYFIENTGCEELRKRVETIKPKLHIFGHIHCGYGTTEKFGVKFANASNCDESYEPTNAPVVIDL